MEREPRKFVLKVSNARPMMLPPRLDPESVVLHETRKSQKRTDRFMVFIEPGHRDYQSAVSKAARVTTTVPALPADPADAG